MSGNPEITNGSQCSRRGSRCRLYDVLFFAGRCLLSDPEGCLQTLLIARRGSLVVPASSPGGMLTKSSCLEEENAQMCRLIFLALLALPLLALAPQPASACWGG
jgi:hypothetical protein